MLASADVAYLFSFSVVSAIFTSSLSSLSREDVAYGCRPVSLVTERGLESPIPRVEEDARHVRNHTRMVPKRRVSSDGARRDWSSYSPDLPP